MKNPLLKQVLKNLLIKGSVPITILLFLMAGAGFYFAKNLELKLSLTDLLPDEHPSVLKFEKITDIVGGVGYLIVVVRSDKGNIDPTEADATMRELEKSPLIRSTFYDREEYFFASRMLYYLENDTLRGLEKAIRKQIQKAKRKVFDLGLFDEEEKKKEEEINTEVRETARKASKITPHLVSKNEEHFLLMIKPSFDSLDMQKTVELVDYTKKTLNENLPSHLNYELAGRYFKKIEDARIIKGDIVILGGLAMLLIAAVLLFYFRSFRPVILIVTPVLVGLGITVGATVLFIGHINIITGFLMGIVSGLGMDYSVHLALRLRLERLEPSSKDPDPCWRSLTTGGHAVFVGALAASVAFFLLCFSDFRAFSEFGFVCGVGIAAVSLSLLFSFSALANWLGLNERNAFRKPIEWAKIPALVSKREFRLGLGLSLMLIILSAFVGFEYDFDRMMQHSKEVRDLTKLVDRIYDRSVIPSVFAAQDKQTAIEVEKSLEEDYLPNTIQSIVSGATIIPEAQDKKKIILRKIHSQVKSLKDSWLEEAIDLPASTIRRWTSAETFGMEQLPIHLQDALRGTGQSDFLLYIYPSVSLSTADGVHQYANMVRDIEERHPNVLTGSDTVVFAEILELIKRDGRLILFAIFSSVGIFLWLNVRRWDDTLACYLPLLIAFPIGAGLMTLFGIRFNILNIAIIPSFIAIGIDVPLHIVHRAREIRSGFKAAADLTAAVNLALVTTGLGFGVLIFARAGVLRSLGWIALLGIIAIWWTGMILLPAVLERMYSNKSAKTPS